VTEFQNRRDRQAINNLNPYPSSLTNYDQYGKQPMIPILGITPQPLPTFALTNATFPAKENGWQPKLPPDPSCTLG